MQKNMKNVVSVSFDRTVWVNYFLFPKVFEYFSVSAMLNLIGFVGVAFDVACSIVLVFMIQLNKEVKACRILECQNLVKAIIF